MKRIIFNFCFVWLAVSAFAGSKVVEMRNYGLVPDTHENLSPKLQKALQDIYNPQIQISAESGTKRSIFRQKNKTKRSKKRLHTTLIKPEQKVNEDLCSGFIVS